MSPLSMSDPWQQTRADNRLCGPLRGCLGCTNTPGLEQHWRVTTQPAELLPPLTIPVDVQLGHVNVLSKEHFARAVEQALEELVATERLVERQLMGDDECGIDLASARLVQENVLKWAGSQSDARHVAC